jgi:RNase adaptor protein for sRNA GlmZ degradation
MTNALVIKSFGLKHADGPEIWAGCTIAFDLREMFKDPHVSPEMRQMTGLDQLVIDNVMAQPGAESFGWNIARVIWQLIEQAPTDETITVGFACVGGRHRSVVFANYVADLLDAWRTRATKFVMHEHINHGVIAR